MTPCRLTPIRCDLLLAWRNPHSCPLPPAPPRPAPGHSGPLDPSPSFRVGLICFAPHEDTLSLKATFAQLAEPRQEYPGEVQSLQQEQTLS